MPGRDLTVREIKELLTGLLPGLIHELVPSARREGNVFSAPNPTRSADGRGSFKVWSNGAWREYDEPEAYGKGDLLDLISYVHGHGGKTRPARKFAVDWAKKRLGLSDRDPRALAKARREVNARSKEREADEAKRAMRKRIMVRELLDKRVAIHPSAPPWLYLAGRGLDLAQLPWVSPCLGYVPSVRHWTSGHTWPAMVSQVLHRDPSLLGLHGTFLEEHEGLWRKVKALGREAKLTLGVVKGGIVPLSLGAHGLTLKDAAADGKACDVILCEGIETGLALAIAIPEARVWSCLNMGNMAYAPVDHPAVSRVIAAIENDIKPQAIRQRESVLEALEAKGKPLATMQPHLGSDFADLTEEN